MNHITDILNLTRKNGKFLLEKEESRNLLTKFRDFDIQNDWIESKDMTKLNKLLAAWIPKVVKLTAREVYPTFISQNTDYIVVRMWENIKACTVEKQQKDLTSFWKYQNLDADDNIAIERILENIRTVEPIVEKFIAMEKRIMRNGKLPLDERVKQERIAIKGKLNPSLDGELTKLKAKWRVIVYDDTLDYLRRIGKRAGEFMIAAGLDKRKISDIHYDEKQLRNDIEYYNKRGVITYSKDGFYIIKSDEEFVKMANQSADDESESFYFKMADKLGGLILDEEVDITELSGDNTPFSSSIRVTAKNGSKFVVTNKIVINTSPLGNPFYQYPTTFHNAFKADGSKITDLSEASLKREFNKQ